MVTNLSRLLLGEGGERLSVLLRYPALNQQWLWLLSFVGLRIVSLEVKKGKERKEGTGVSQVAIFNSTNTTHVFRCPGSGGRLRGGRVVFRPRVWGGTYCFWEGPRVGLCRVRDPFLQTGLFAEFSLGAENRARSGPRVLTGPGGVAHHLAHGAQRAFPPRLPLRRFLLVFNGVPGQKNKNKANKFEAGRQTKIDKTK